jgi:hypothetical protein
MIPLLRDAVQRIHSESVLMRVVNIIKSRAWRTGVEQHEIDILARIAFTVCNTNSSPALQDMVLRTLAKLYSQTPGLSFKVKKIRDTLRICDM